MKWISYLPLIFLIISCSSQTTQGPESTSIPDTSATVIATSPSLEITFDGFERTIKVSHEITKGEHVFLLNNQSGQRSFLIVGRMYKETSWENFLQWFEDECGPPGSSCEGGDPPGISWLFEDKISGQGLNQRYFQYDLNWNRIISL